MKKILISLIVIFVCMSCSKNDQEFHLIEKKGIIEYPELKAYIDYQSETKLHWKTVYADGKVATGEENLSYKKLSDELHFLNWIEKDGATVSQVINTKTSEVKTFWSFNDENSSQGNRSFMFLDGKFTFDK